MKKERLPLIYHWISGAIGKRFVIKQYKYGTVKTKYPDMTKIIASKKQRICRDLFRDAVAYAKTVMADPQQKAAWLKKVRHKCKVFPMIVRHYMLEAKEAAIKRKNATKQLIRSCFKSSNSTFERSKPVLTYPDNESTKFQKTGLRSEMCGASTARRPEKSTNGRFMNTNKKHCVVNNSG